MDVSDKSFPDLVSLLKTWIPWQSEPANVSRVFWMPDHSCRVCYECDSQFNLFNRRHHCRHCGRIFCAKCTSNWVPASTCELTTFQEEWQKLRVCNYCFKQWNQNLHAAVDKGAQVTNLDLSTSPSAASFISSISSSTINSSSKSSGIINSINITAATMPQSGGVSSPESAVMETVLDTKLVGEAGIRSDNDIETLNLDQFHNGYGYSISRQSKDDDEEFGVYPLDNCRHFQPVNGYYGHTQFDEIDNDCGSCKVYPDADAIDKNTVDNLALYNGFDSQVSEEVQQILEKEVLNNIGDECETTSSLYAAQDLEAEPVDFENNGLLWLPPEPENEDDEREALLYDDEEDGNATGEWGHLRASNSFRSREKSNAEHKMVTKNVVDGHFRALVAQLLQVENLPVGEDNEAESWLQIITSLSWEAATLLKPDTSKGGGMDPGGYVKIKCLAAGLCSESKVIKGVVYKKNVAHRRMASKLEKPRIMILSGALEYQRVTNHLSSFDTLLQQEMDHLKMAVAKIDSYNPDVLLVEKSVSRYAQEYLLSKDISLALNIKRPILERIARCTGCQIVPSIDHLSSQKLGYCDMFHVDRFLEEHGTAGQSGKKMVKTLMYFEGCPKPLGCTILLRGASGDELKKVKHVMQYSVFAAYHLALETSFLADEGASLPAVPFDSVALLDKPSVTDRSISTVPGFDAPVTLGPQPGVDPLRLNSLPPPQPGAAEVSVPKTEIQEGPSAQLLSCSVNEPSVGGTLAASLESYISNLSLPDEVLHSIKGSIGTDFCMASNILVEDVPSDTLKDSRAMDADPVSTDQMSSPVEAKEVSEEQDSLNEEFPPSPSDHQSILVSLSSRCIWKGTVCERSHLFRIKYYGNFDKPLGRFLRDHLFDQSYRCRSCEMPSDAHVQCYTHLQGTLTISVKKLSELLLAGEKDGKIWMWHRCLRCPRTNGFPPATRRVVMSDAAWGLSFGKFLELSFSNHAAASRVASCGHSLHRDCLRFYGFGKMVACFHYASINVHSVFLPPAKLDFKCDSQAWVQKELNEVIRRSELLFLEVLDTLSHLLKKIFGLVAPTGGNTVMESKRRVSEYEDLLQMEKADFSDSLEKILGKEPSKGQPVVDILEINRLRRQLLIQSYMWDQRLIHLASSLNKLLESDGVVSNVIPTLGSNPLALVNQGTKAVHNESSGLSKSNPALPRALSNRQLSILESLTESLDAAWTGDNNLQSIGISKGTSLGVTLVDYTPVYISSLRDFELQGDGPRLLLPVGFNDIVIPVYDDEPTSIIAYALLTPDYLSQTFDDLDRPKDADSTISLQSFDSMDERSLESYKSFGSTDGSFFSVSSSRTSLTSDPVSCTKALHARVSFTDPGPFGKFYTVTCYYGKQFESLRRICCPSEFDFVRSLSRCKKWGAQGGKSNVFFAKTLDDRFIIKQVTKTELESFIKFAPEYFKYLTEAIGSQCPTSLAKVLGIFQVTIKQVKGGKETKMDVLVMENLLFGRNITRLYDLKGSSRSRYNPDSNGINKVLLDQNLIEAMPTSPIFVGNKAKRLLERAVWNDTSFLASVDVMDYSLLVGIDKETQELVLGIIDFMRQYTWDKHLETWVKASGILGGPKNSSPTVISPKQYKKRFRKAMTTYFLMVPDQWSPPHIVPSLSQTDLRLLAEEQ